MKRGDREKSEKKEREKEMKKKKRKEKSTEEGTRNQKRKLSWNLVSKTNLCGVSNRFLSMEIA